MFSATHTKPILNCNLVEYKSNDYRYVQKIQFFDEFKL